MVFNIAIKKVKAHFMKIKASKIWHFVTKGGLLRGKLFMRSNFKVKTNVLILKQF